MTSNDFMRESAHVRQSIGTTALSNFGVPHLIVDKVFPEDLVARINESWPAYGEGFFPEVPGNHILQMYRKSYGGLSEARLSFWKSFNETLWPDLVSAVAEAFTTPCYQVFGELYYKHLSLDHPLTLMQGDPSYPGHDMHQHFYHAPHWAFTMLLYIDPDDSLSCGTTLHKLQPRDGSKAGESSYQRHDVDWRTDVAFDTFHWEDPKIPDRKYSAKTADYKSNRLFVFMDGPLALHSVAFDNPDRSPNPERARDGGRHARRRILRSHVKVHHAPFYEKHSQQLPGTLDPTAFMRVMAPNAVLSAEDQDYKQRIVRPFFRERLKAYCSAAERGIRPRVTDRLRPVLRRIANRSGDPQGREFNAGLLANIP